MIRVAVTGPATEVIVGLMPVIPRFGCVHFPKTSTLTLSLCMAEVEAVSSDRSGPPAGIHSMIGSMEFDRARFDEGSSSTNKRAVNRSISIVSTSTYVSIGGSAT